MQRLLNVAAHLVSSLVRYRWSAEAMKKSPGFACALCVFATVAGYAQTVSQIHGSDPFRIDQGSSFSASTTRPNSLSERSANTPAVERIISDIQQAFDIVRDKHVNGTNVDKSALTKSSISSMLSELDPHSNYLDAAEFSELLGDQDSEYSGTGSTISNFVRNGTIDTFIIATQPGSAAAKANLQYGDRIVTVDGLETRGLGSDVIRDRVRGPRGTKVRLTVERAATGQIETIELTRDRVFQPTLPNYFIVQDGVGYIDLSEGFSHTTSVEFTSATRELHRRGMTSLILDLRGNGGGILDQAIKIAEQFLPASSTIISQRGRSAVDNREWKSTNRAPENLPLVILVNDQTASASEVVAGALQDNDRALIVGQNTFGKGLVQNVVGLPMGSGLTLTTARYFTPSGRSIQRSYTGVGMYDYFNLEHGAEGSGKAGKEARTVTNRKVFGGNGISPDEVLEADKFDSKKAALLDPIFFFVRDLVNGRGSYQGSSISLRDQVRQSIIFGYQPFGQDLLSRFVEYTRKTELNISARTVEANARFITRRLNYELALATVGRAAAKQALIAFDTEISKAIESLPKAAYLADAARKARTSPEHKKSRRVAFPAGQVRNRRN